MYNSHKICLSIIFLGISIGCYFLKLDSQVSSVILTAVSIIFGFNITAIIAIYGNKTFIDNFSNKIDNKSRLKQTKLQTIKQYFSINFIVSIVCIIVCILSIIFNNLNVIILNSIIAAIAIAVFTCNIFITLLLIRVLMNSFK